MRRSLVPLLWAGIAIGSALYGQEPVCDLFKDLKSYDGRQVVLTGELIVSRSVAAIGAADCDYWYRSGLQRMPAGLSLRPSEKATAEQAARLRDAGLESDRLRRSGKAVTASATLIGSIHLGEVNYFPAELVFDSIEDLKVEALPDAGVLPVIQVCDLFQDLPKWKGQRIAVRGEVVSTMEGSWLDGRCLGNFYTKGYRWSVGLSVGWPAYFSSSVEPLVRVKKPSADPKGFDQFHGKPNVVTTATYIGRLRMRDQYLAVCRPWGEYLTNGFGHLNGAAAEIVLEEVRDVELSHAPATQFPKTETHCDPVRK